jgi:hypothetical protein
MPRSAVFSKSCGIGFSLLVSLFPAEIAFAGADGWTFNRPEGAILLSPAAGSHPSIPSPNEGAVAGRRNPPHNGRAGFELLAPPAGPNPGWNTFLGGSGSDYGYGIAVDDGGNIYVTGYSGSAWGNPVNDHSGGGYDAFAAKLDSSGAVIWNTFLGGSATDAGSGIAVDGSGNVYVTGFSDAAWGSPVRPFAGSSEAFAAKLDPAGNLTWSTFLGGSGWDAGYGVSEYGGNIFLTGYSTVAWGSPIRAHAGDYDAFAAKLDSTGNLTWSTFLGGSGEDQGIKITAGGSGDVYISGYSGAGWGSPAHAYAGGYDAFAAKLNPSTGALVWNTFLGGAGADIGYALAADGSGNVHVSGWSNAGWGSPVRAFSGASEAFACKLNADGIPLWNTFLGGSGDDFGSGAAVDAYGNVFVSGYSDAAWGNPVNPFSGGNDAFVVEINSSGALLWNTFMGGSGTDLGTAVAIHGGQHIYATGYSEAAWGSPVRAYAALSDAFVAEVENPAPGSFGKLSPADGSTVTTSPTLSWEESPAAEYYIYCVDTVDNGVCDTAWEYAGTATGAALSGLDEDETYFWFVAATNGGGTTYADGGAWWSFRTPPPPPGAFIKYFPAIGTFQSSDPVLHWAGAGGAEAYAYCYDTSNNDACDSSWISTGTATSIGLSSLDFHTTYYWQVRATNAGGMTYADGGTWWSFRTATFADVPVDHPFWQYVESLYYGGITTGCGVSPLIYCPEQNVTRAAMAVFLLRSKYGAGHAPPAATHTFADLPVAGKEWQEAWVDQFYLEGITSGCGTNPLIYCPENPVTRAAMAVFILRALEGASYTPPAAGHYFSDLPVSGKEWMEPWVDELYRRGITTGCGVSPLIYCPENPVKRQAMAAFIVRAFGIPLP